MPRPTLVVSGARRLRATLAAAGDELVDLRQANRDAAEVAAGAARQAAPRRSGALVASILPSAVKGGALVRAGGPRVPYANVIHWGWRARGIESQPFALQAAEQTAPRDKRRSSESSTQSKGPDRWHSSTPYARP